MTGASRQGTTSLLDAETNHQDHLAVRVWLYMVACLVMAMIVIGGATRLTDSGLSITEWQPLLGAIPPLTEQDWQAAFAKYKEIPEYQLVNKGMSMAEFQFIYWWEWAHRFFGRMIGVAFAIPFLVFWATGRIPDGLFSKLVGIFALGGLQGFFGWYMVQSGLSERVDVSHYRLALHLTTAFVILAAILWVAFGLERDEVRVRLHTLGEDYARTARWLLILLFLQVIIGAFVAGLKAGLTHNTWPLMDGQIVPDGLLVLAPWFMNFVENPLMAQFVHRLLAYLLVGLAIWHAISIWHHADDERVVTSSIALAIALLCQAGLGIWTLLAAANQAEIPIGLGLAHQGFASIVMLCAVLHLRRIVRAVSE